MNNRKSRIYEQMKRLTIKTSVLAGLALLAGAAIAPAPAHADASGFLKSIEGSWKGRGTAKLPGRGDSESVSCRVTSSYAESETALQVKGDCATTQAKTPVNGKITHNGDTVSGSLLNGVGGATMTKSEGKVKGNQLVVLSNFVDDRTGQLTRSRQVIRKTGSGFQANFYIYDNGSKQFEPAGELKFTAR